MADRRMFSLSVVDTDKFLEMPATTQLLYFHLGMRADDDGFVSSPKRIAKTIGSNEDDLKLLIAKSYLIPFDNGVVVISDWNVNNWIRPDRKHNTRFLQEKSLLELKNDIYVLSDELQSYDNHMTTECHAEDRLSKDRLSKVKEREERENTGYQQIADLYNDICKSFPRLSKLSDSRRKAIKARMNQGYSVEDFKRLFEAAEASSFLKGQNDRNWSATFDWLVKDSNMAKVLDGNYADRRQQAPEEERRSQYKSYEEFERELREDGVI